PPQGQTRRRLVTATVRLLRRRGLHGTGLQDVLEESGAPRGSLYFHFPGGKEQLVAEAVGLAGQRGEEWVRRCLDGAPTAADGVARMLEEYAVLLEGQGFAGGCPVAAVALDLGPEPGLLQEACGTALDSWVAPLAERLQGEGHGPRAAQELALTAIAVFEGALLVGRARRDASAVRAVAARTRALLRSAN
ncbi:MAG TPA: TetR/AcrR family transcriptional regulator, partial [Candidatus Dormibacteraeota bacterium]|nr:TetR/AcrR family transcriptional regulator [Candidatus Dormibacteraeota bacterium]